MKQDITILDIADREIMEWARVNQGLAPEPEFKPNQILSDAEQADLSLRLNDLHYDVSQVEEMLIDGGPLGAMLKLRLIAMTADAIAQQIAHSIKG